MYNYPYMRPLQDLYTMEYQDRLEEDKPIDYTVSTYNCIESTNILLNILHDLKFKSVLSNSDLLFEHNIKDLYYNTLTNVWSKHEKTRGLHRWVR